MAQSEVMRATVAARVHCAACAAVENVYFYCMKRLAEVMLTAAMSGVALVLLFSPQSLRLNSFRYMQAIGFTEATIIGLFAVGSALRIAAFIANGSWPKWGPMCRAWGALIGATIWAQMAIGLWQFSLLQNGAISTGVPVYLVLTLGELISIHRARLDDRTRR